MISSNTLPIENQNESISPKQETKRTYLMYFSLVLFVVLGSVGIWMIQPGLPVSPEPVVVKDTIVSMQLAFVGDLMCHMPIANEANLGPDSFDFKPGFKNILPQLEKPDWLFGNLETVTAGIGERYTGYPAFNTPQEYVEALKVVGFDFLATVNNHALDRSFKGVEKTYKLIDSLGMGHTGTFLSPEDRDSIRFVNLDKIGLKMAVLGYSYSTNGMPIPAGKPWCINLMDSTLIEKDVKKARSLGADLVMVYFHWGEEYQRVPNAYQKRFASHTMNCGADFIIGGHPHVLQPVEKYKTINATLDSGLIAWSLGNFYSNQTQRFADAGAILYMTLTRNTESGKVWIGEVKYFPTWVYRAYNPLEKFHYIFPASTGTTDSCPSFFSVDNKRQVKEAFSDTKGKMSEGMGVIIDN